MIFFPVASFYLLLYSICNFISYFYWLLSYNLKKIGVKLLKYLVSPSNNKYSENMPYFPWTAFWTKLDDYLICLFSVVDKLFCNQMNVFLLAG